MLRTSFLKFAVVSGTIALTTQAAIAQSIPDREIRIGFAVHSIALGALFGQLREGFRAHPDNAGVKKDFFKPLQTLRQTMRACCASLRTWPRSNWTTCLLARHRCS